jgi:uncharacterized protein YnzC (UPF0291/DUF896 family)
MLIRQVYSIYKIPPNLAEHMLRVAALGQFIATSWKDSVVVDSNLVTKTLLLHDMGNIIKFDFNNYPKLLGKEKKNINYWKNVQTEFVTKYGNNESVATLKIAQELNTGKNVLTTLRQLVSQKKGIKFDSWELKICYYSDWRVSPFGLTSLSKRMNEFLERKKARGITEQEVKKYLGIKEYCQQLEEQIQQNISVDLKSINEESLQERTNLLLETNI